MKLYDLVFLRDEEVQIMSICPLNPKYESSLWKNIIIHKT